MSDLIIMDCKHEGEATETGFENKIACIAAQYAAEVPITYDRTKGGRTAGVAVHKPVVVVKAVDKSTPKLFESLCKADSSLGDVKLHFLRQSGGKPEKYMTIELGEAMVARLETFVPGDEQDDPTKNNVPLEKVSISYKTIKFTYVPQKTDGSMGGNVQAGWDVIANKAA